MKGNSGKRYDREFKLGAVNLVIEQGQSISAVAKDLGVTTASVRDWVEGFKRDNSGAFPGSGNLAPRDEELYRLREENRILRMERDLLKKTLPLFMEARK